MELVKWTMELLSALSFKQLPHQCFMCHTPLFWKLLFNIWKKLLKIPTAAHSQSLLQLFFLLKQMFSYNADSLVSSYGFLTKIWSLYSPWCKDYCVLGVLTASQTTRKRLFIFFTQLGVKIRLNGIILKGDAED